MFEDIVRYIATVPIPVFWILIIALLNTFTENIFPPAPCDTILVIMGGFVGLGRVDFASMMVFSTIGSTIGFALMYWLGREFGEKIIESKRFSFINHANMEKPREWFRKHGYIIIIANRFLSGTRAVISFFAGISNLPPTKTILLSSISAMFWNAILIALGMIFGKNWLLADKYLRMYGNAIAVVLVVAAIIFAARYIIRKRRSPLPAND